MLVVARFVDESVILGAGLAAVKVIEIRRDKVRLGIAAPPLLPVHRDEVHEAIRRTRGYSPAGRLRDHGRIITPDGHSLQHGLLIECPSQEYQLQAIQAGFCQFRLTEIDKNAA